MIDGMEARMAKGLVTLALVAAAAALGVAPAVADEAKAPVSASMFLSIMTAPVEGRELAFDRSLKEPGPPPRPGLVEVLPDGSVKMDRAVVTVRNPCPPGTTHYEPAPLPGRRARN
jgi:hypothetical protein